MHGCKVGKKLICKQWPIFRSIPDSNLVLGDNVIIGHQITLGFAGKGRMRIGNNVELSHNVLISAGYEVTIEDNSMVGENVTIRDDNHRTAKDSPIYAQGWEFEPVHIGKDVWIGASSCVLLGADIAEGCIIAANSVVLGKSETEPYGVYAGSPVRKVSERRSAVLSE